MPVAVAVGALCVAVTSAFLLPAGAPAGQSSQATSAPFSQVGAGLYHSCALVDDATTPAPASRPVRCWGFSGDGQVGYGNILWIGDDETPAAVGPVDLGAGRTAKALAVGDYHTCAVLDNGDVRCWGYANEGQVGYGNRNQIGDNETPGSVGPVDLGSGRTAIAITAGGNHSCAVLDNGTVRCWGLGEYGQLGYGNTASIGDGERVDSVNPVNLSGHTAKAISAGLGHTCAILDDDNVRCWGIGGNGQLGYSGSTSAVLSPSTVGAVDVGDGVKAITTGAAHTCVVLNSGAVRCWGLNDVGQLGYGNKLTIGDNETPGSVGPVDIGQGRTAVAISAAGDHTCVVLDDGTVRCWGGGIDGQLGQGNLQAIGDNETPGSVAPIDFGPGRIATAVGAGIYHTCVRFDDGDVQCWGNGANGRLGHCNEVTVGDDETPAAIALVDLGSGGAACPPVPPPPVAPPPPPPPPPAGPAPAATAPDGIADALRGQAARSAGLRDCRAAVTTRLRTDRAQARRYLRGTRVRALALRRAALRARAGRARCVREFGRTPGRIQTVTAKSGARGTIVLTFLAPGTDGANAPAARRYLIKQSLRPIRTAQEFDRAPALCRGSCAFSVTRPGATIRLEVERLRPNTTYYYKLAARDNVSNRPGPRSVAVHATPK